MDNAFHVSLQAVFYGITHHWQDDIFATCGHQVDIWDETRSEPIRTFTWGLASVEAIKFNPTEVSRCNITQCIDNDAFLQIQGILEGHEEGMLAHA